MFLAVFFFVLNDLDEAEVSLRFEGLKCSMALDIEALLRHLCKIFLTKENNIFFYYVIQKVDLLHSLHLTIITKDVKKCKYSR